MSSEDTGPADPKRDSSAGLEYLYGKQVSAGQGFEAGLSNLLKHIAAQIDVFQLMLSQQVLLEVVLPGPVFEFIFALFHITPIDDLVSTKNLVDTSLMSIKVVVGTEALGRLGAALNGAFVGLVVSSFVLPGRLCQLTATGAADPKRTSTRISS